jgi:hypothetical protein
MNKNNNNNNSIKKNNLNFSEEISFNNNNNNKNQSMKSQSKRIINHKSLPKIKLKSLAEIQANKIKNNLMYYYLLPMWILRKYKIFKNMYLIKEKICGYFSIEKFNELIKFKEILEKNNMQLKSDHPQLFTINNTIIHEKKDLINERNKII